MWRFGRVKMPDSESSVVKSFFERSIEWMVECRVVSVLGSHASNSLSTRIRVCSAGIDEITEAISAGWRSMLARPR